MTKSPDAFRTISEVAEWLGVQAHVLRFWESKFSQVKPVKRAGGRRYYRPNDMLLLGGIRKLLHEDGLTIKGVQKILREQGVATVVALSPPLDDLTAAQVQGNGNQNSANEDEVAELIETLNEAPVAPAADSDPDQPELNLTVAPATSDSEEPAQPSSGRDVPEQTAAPSAKQAEGDETPAASEAADPADKPAPTFFRRHPDDDDAGTKTAPAESEKTPLSDADIADVPDESSFPAQPSALSMAFRARRLDLTDVDALRSHVARLAALRDQMADANKAARKE
ncbi:MAG: MerR family transcriptional regulator [Pseudomonadota bacterium]